VKEVRSTLNEFELVEASKKGNKSAQNTLLTENYSILKGYTIKMTGDPYLAQDIIQETMLKALININKFTPYGKFSTWLIKISTNVYRDYLRKTKVSEPLDEALESSQGNVENITISNIEYKEIMQILLKISYEKRAVFILKHYYGYKYEEISEMLGCPVGTVRSRLHNCIKYILSEMEEREVV
jgi:RNA polymerase sigma-70 factor (ECF subfamily)